uniref:UTP6 small subunit processome component n=1 Tax=Coturnix japonica TaxID=93934 RepID=A0A8C2UK96_COTJA
MAERVEQRLEDRVPELEQLERVGLFTHEEIRAVLKKATALEYKIQRRALRKEDFINYIQYEINLLELIKKRRARTGYSFKKDEIEGSMIQRVHSLFKRATGKWKEDVQLWLSHVAFCKQWNTKHQLSKVFSTMLAIHPNKPALWIMAAKWEMETRLSSESARHLFLRALRFHPECPKLYQEYFRMELMNAEKQRKEKKEFERAKMNLDEFNYSEKILNGEMARIIYRDAVEKIKGDLTFLLLGGKAVMFRSPGYVSLQAEYADNPLTWDYMARRELELGSLKATEPTTKQAKVSEMTQREERCCAVFEEAVTAHIVCCESFEEGCQYLSQKAAEVAEAAAKRFSLSVEMWQMRLQVLIQLKSDNVTQCFEEAFKHVKSKVCGTLPLWTLWVEWSEAVNSKDDTEALYQRSLHAVAPAESVTMKEKYLDWAYRNGGYKKARRVFTSLHESHPLSLDFFKKMIEIEKEQEMCRMLRLREYYERALREFGSVNSDLWLEYIKEELSHPQGKPEHAGSIHWRAVKMLEGDQVEDFISKYTLLQTGHL